ncbi:cytochrome P450 [Mycolicibacterium parafortuitum]|uniref:Steroid C26-monooxygenase n=1 Tax=Mycolicibacterium parafortuitum TaxID=39692 RepID=A0A375YER5_MYCPF|nr:cytochrome P450 [Mycolicibacterium parafortuitum]ORB31605.1 cytochrome [Mycolicibacterium parafortuitum]SRX79617.1 cytochrome P450 [Ilumatobacter coccineus YM16-304] [Mycolicibacterium parafortuitum]
MTISTTVQNVFDAGLPTLTYDLAATPADVWPSLQDAQRAAPIAIGPLGPEVLSYEMARAILRDTRFKIPPGINLAAQGVTSGPLFDKVMSGLLCLEGAEHQRLRKLVSKAFTPRATDRLQGTIVEVVSDLADRVADAGRCDVVADIARPYPIPIICALLGAPREDWRLFSEWAEEVIRGFSFSTDIAAIQDEVMRAWLELDDYVDAMVEHRRAHLTDDLLSDLIRAEDDGDRLTKAELKMLAASLLMAGTDTTRNQLAASVQALCAQPDQWALLADQPDLAMRAVDETMRLSPVVCGTPRIVPTDMEFGGFLFPANTFVFVNILAANRDPAVYADAGRLDLEREGAPAILTFSGGVHYCLGANLARRELAEALRILAARWSNPRCRGDVPWKPMLGLTGPTVLELEFDA